MEVLKSQKDKHLISIEYLYKALELTEDIADVASLLGMEYLYIDDYVKARESFQMCLEDDVEDYSSLYNIIYCFPWNNIPSFY